MAELRTSPFAWGVDRECAAHLRFNDQDQPTK
jgi:hypothetical protein